MSAPIVPKMSETGTSKGSITTRDKMSHKITAPVPNTHTHGRFVFILSPRTMDTMFGTMSPQKGRFPTTADTIPTASETKAVPTSTTRL